MTSGAPVPTTTPVRGGRSAWAGALVVVALLGGLVWVGVTGRPTSTARPAVADLPSAEAETPGPEATAGQGTAVPTTLPPLPSLSPSVLAGESFGVSAAIGSRQYLALLDELEPGYLFATFRVSNPPEAGQGTLSLKQFWRQQSLEDPVPVGQWPLPLDALLQNGRERQTVIDINVPARPRLLNVPTPVLRGYRLTVYTQNELLFGTVDVEIRIGPNQRIVGDDGIFGWPTVAQLRSSRVARGLGLYNRCRWDFGPQAQTPYRPDHDEASC